MSKMKMIKSILVVFVLIVFTVQGRSEDTISTTTYIYDTIYSGVTEYIDYPYSDGLSILEESNHKGNARTVWLDLMFPTFLYKSSTGFIGNDTVKVLNFKYEQAPDTLVYILYSKAFEFTEDTVIVKYVTRDCKHDEHETEFEAIYQTDSVLIRGTVYANCCADKRVLATYQNNAVNITYDLSSGGCTCNCNYDYEVSLPLDGNETHVKLGANQIALGTEIDFGGNSISVFPNPAKSSFSFSINAIYTHIQILSVNGKILKQYQQADQYSVSSLTTGSYLICVFDGEKIIATETLQIIN